MKIGVLSFQGGVIEHINQIKALGHTPIEVNKASNLDNIDGIILPGGESTTIGKLLNITGLMNPLREKIKQGLPTWGTCAGMILLAKDIESQDESYLGILDVNVRRNAFGTQLDSFKSYKIIKEVSDNEIELVFIRAPIITKAGNNVKTLCKINDNIVAVKHKNILATSFHPELTNNTSFLEYFISSTMY